MSKNHQNFLNVEFHIYHITLLTPNLDALFNNIVSEKHTFSPVKLPRNFWRNFSRVFSNYFRLNFMAIFKLFRLFLLFLGIFH